MIAQLSQHGWKICSNLLTESLIIAKHCSHSMRIWCEKSIVKQANGLCGVIPYQHLSSTAPWMGWHHYWHHDDVMTWKWVHNYWPFVRGIDQWASDTTMASWYGNTFYIAGLLWGEFNSNSLIPSQRTGDMKLWYGCNLNKLLNKVQSYMWLEKPSWLRGQHH